MIHQPKDQQCPAFVPRSIRRKTIRCLVTGAALIGAVAWSSFPTVFHPKFALAAASTSTSSSSPSARTVQIQIANDNYSPSQITVPAGTTVVWTNDDLVIHSVTSGNGKPNGLFDHDVAPYAQFSYTFTKPGTYPYYCKYHTMAGTIVVTGSGTGGQGMADQGDMGNMGPSTGGMNMSGSGASTQGVYGPYGSSKDEIAPLGTGTYEEPVLPDGLRLLPYTMQGGYKVFHLTAEPVWWDPSKGKPVEAWTYNGSVPGPEIKVNTGDKVKVIVTNKLPEGTTVHWHGLDVPFVQDGTGESQPDLQPGHSQTYTFTVGVPPGTYIYHAHPMLDMSKQEKLGLWGPLIVEPKGTGWNKIHPGFQREYTLVINDSPQFGNTINGKLYPFTPALKAKLGDKVLVHVVNIGSMNHPLSLDGMHFQELEQDGYPLPAPVWMSTLDTQPGTTYDIAITASNPGKWLLASSVPDQISAPDGRLSGMATIFAVYGEYGSSTEKIAPMGTGSEGEPLLPDGLRLLPYTMQGGYKVFHLTAKPVWWDDGDGQKVEAWAYNGTVPGPEIQVNVGDKVEIVVQNDLPQGTTVHWQGLDVPFRESGMGGLSQPDIMPGESWTYRFTVRAKPGAYLYRAEPSRGMAKQDAMGLWGPVIVEPKGTPWRHVRPGYDEEYTLMIDDSGQLGFNINGKSFPFTRALTTYLGDHVLIHLINVGSMEHPMHLHGMHFQEMAQDGEPLPSPIWMDTIATAPGTTYDIRLEPNQPGRWLFHCHIVDHVVGATGRMMGLVTFIDVKKLKND
ncbi:hypothetical protein GCM10010885_23100 [Alicyclobacillus cellulosilyticus]|uniref:Multicopper oxidase n=1 Tax=Alicyclobacillus cellulosilyticus TaxID=1003997 RepID=A0A917NNC0_9BACL|nr:multicopper oxidase domain-containing protein [Alicyclobacillus cellulosilyticus]GGJ13174.1 hypothetical protein GCM10010885_23100 [Alicyclobacillus cellulosilyticus]